MRLQINFLQPQLRWYLKSRGAPDSDFTGYPANLKAGYRGYPAEFLAQHSNIL
jgi:hypothetical protein